MLHDSHIHFFSPGYEHDHLAKLDDPMAGRATSPDELTLYQSLRKHWQIDKALVVGFEGLAKYAGNNDYLASIVRDHDWLCPTAFVKPESLTMALLQQRNAQGFVGVSMYLNDDAADALAHVPADVWQWLTERRAIISLNAPASATKLWQTWRNILQVHPSLTLLVSHLGLPGHDGRALTTGAIHQTLAGLLSLAKFPGVHVKFSAFYATSDPMHDYPHAHAEPTVQALLDAFGHDRLLWGSDFSPCLGYVSFAQTIDAARYHLSDATEAQQAAVMGENLARLLAQVTMGKQQGSAS